MSIKKLACLSVVLFFGLLIFIQNASAKQADDVRFSITVWGESLETVLADIKQKTGFTIVLNSHIRNEPIAGIYNNISFADFFAIVLDERDISISTNSKNKRITVSKLNARNSMGARSLSEPDNSRQEIDAFIASEADYIIEAKRSAKFASYQELQDLDIDPLTGASWHEVEQALRSSGNSKAEKNQMTEADFLAAESDFISKARMSAHNKNVSEKTKKNINIDPMSGKNWEEVDSELELIQQTIN